MIEYLTDNFPPLEDVATGTKVGIGVATGADSVFITADRTVAEPDRLLPLAMVSYISSGTLDWSGKYLVNPWDENGLVRLCDHPRLFGYLDRHRDVLRRRHVASRSPDRWYRTIDRVDPTLTGSPKLLIPDMRMSMHPVLDTGKTYPHHNLYVVTSTGWDLRVLGGLLLSRVATAFIEAFCVRMRGGVSAFRPSISVASASPQLRRSTTKTLSRFRPTSTDAMSMLRLEIALRLYGPSTPAPVAATTRTTRSGQPLRSEPDSADRSSPPCLPRTAPSHLSQHRAHASRSAAGGSSLLRRKLASGLRLILVEILL